MYERKTQVYGEQFSKNCCQRKLWMNTLLPLDPLTTKSFHSLLARKHLLLNLEIVFIWCLLWISRIPLILTQIRFLVRAFSRVSDSSIWIYFISNSPELSLSLTIPSGLAPRKGCVFETKKNTLIYSNIVVAILCLLGNIIFNNFWLLLNCSLHCFWCKRSVLLQNFSQCFGWWCILHQGCTSVSLRCSDLNFRCINHCWLISCFTFNSFYLLICDKQCFLDFFTASTNHLPLNIPRKPRKFVCLSPCWSYFCLPKRVTQTPRDQLALSLPLFSVKGNCVIVRVSVVLKGTDVGDWRFDNLSGSHL